MQNSTAAFVDIAESLRRWPVWVLLGWNDIKGRYRRSLLGPFWLTIGTGITVGGMGVIWSILFNMPVATFFPYLTAGLITWMLLSSVVIDGSTVFSAQANVIRGIKMPLTIHALRLSFRSLLVFFHNLVVFVLVALIFPPQPSWWMLAFIPGVLLVMVNCVWVSIFFGLLGARFRDLPPIVAAITSLLFFLTPIMWEPSMLGRSEFIAQINPFTHLVAVVREPLLGRPPGILAYAATIAITLVGWWLTFALFQRYRSRIVFWV